MSNLKLSPGLFDQLGGSHYLSRPAYFQQFADDQLAAPEVAQKEGLEELSSVLHDQQVTTAVDEESVSSMPVERPNQAAAEQAAIVLLGAGLNSIWEDESKLEWQLLMNICRALGWSEEALAFFDTDALISDEAVFTTMEEVIDLGVEWVLSMDSEHSISEQLAEGVQVLEVPGLEQMLSDPYAKQSFYQTIVPFLNQP